MAENWNIGLDLGGEGVRMALRRGGIVYSQSACAAFRSGSKEYAALGDEARALRGREPVGMRTGVMLEGGRVAREQLIDMWIPYLLRLAQKQGGGRTGVLLVGGPNAREADLQALRAGVNRAGGGSMSVLEAELAAALGAWYPQDAGTEDGAQIDVMESTGSMVVDVGAGSAFAAIIAGGHIVRRADLPFGLSGAEQGFRGALRTEYALAAGENTAQDAFRALCLTDPEKTILPLNVDGLHLTRLMPASIPVRVETARQALEPYAREIGRMAASVLAHGPAELAGDLYSRGILLTGGGARFPMVQRAVAECCGVRVRVSDQPEQAAIRGVLRVMNAPNRFGDLPLTTED